MDGENLSIEQSDTLQQLQQNKGLPTGEANPPIVVEAEPVEAAAPMDEAAMVEVDGQKFVNESEAFKYLQGRYGETKTESMINEARLQGMQDAYANIPQQQTQQAVEPEDDFDQDKYYEDPVGYTRAREAKLEAKLLARFSAQQTQSQRETQVWNKFANQYPDLADFKQDVDAIAAEHGETVRMLAKRDEKKAMDYVAMKVREKFQRYVEAMKPTKILANTKAGASLGGYQPVTSQQNQPSTDINLDFAAQLRSIRKR